MDEERRRERLSTSRVIYSRRVSYHVMSYHIV